MTQWQDMLTLLRAGTVTPLQAWGEMGIYRCADAVNKLRARGFAIRTEMKPFTTSRGRRVKFAEYHLVSEPKGMRYKKGV